MARELGQDRRNVWNLRGGQIISVWRRRFCFYSCKNLRVRLPPPLHPQFRRPCKRIRAATPFSVRQGTEMMMKKTDCHRAVFCRVNRYENKHKPWQCGTVPIAYTTYQFPRLILGKKCKWLEKKILNKS